MIQALTFYAFAAVTLAAGILVISSRNPVHSVLWLIVAFFNAAGLFVLMGAEFLAMVLVVVYVGAVAVLFLFVVMMLDVNFRELRQGAMQYLPLGGAIGLLLLVELALVSLSWVISPESGGVHAAPAPALTAITNTHALGQVLYTKYVFLFQAAGMILLVAMVGAIVLTLRSRTGVLKQRIGEQVARSREQSVSVVKVPTRSGV